MLYFVLPILLFTIQMLHRGSECWFLLLLITCNFVVSVQKSFLFLRALRMGCVILFWHSLGLPYNFLLDALSVA